jgi:hypothetical protein
MNLKNCTLWGMPLNAVSAAAPFSIFSRTADPVPLSAIAPTTCVNSNIAADSAIAAFSKINIPVAYLYPIAPDILSIAGLHVFKRLYYALIYSKMAGLCFYGISKRPGEAEFGGISYC